MSQTFRNLIIDVIFCSQNVFKSFSKVILVRSNIHIQPPTSSSLISIQPVYNISNKCTSLYMKCLSFMCPSIRLRILSSPSFDSTQILMKQSFKVLRQKHYKLMVDINCLPSIFITRSAVFIIELRGQFFKIQIITC